MLINDFCNRIKSRFADARKKRRQHDILTSDERKQQWYEKFQKKLFSENRTKDTQRTKVYKKIFNNKWKQIWIAYQTKHSRDFCLTLTNDITIKRLKLHEKLIKLENSLTTQICTKRIKLTDYLFNKKKCQRLSHSRASATELNKTSNISFYNASITRRAKITCLKKRIRQTFDDSWSSSRKSRRW